jgi:hypothetical protein
VSRPALGGVLAGGLLLGIVRDAVAQRTDERGQFSSGAELRVLSFDRLPSVTRLRQFSLPIAAIAPMGRLTVDFGTAWASTELTQADGARHTSEHLTDTQVRGAYVFGRDAVVATVLVNLPTGPRRASALDYTVIGAVSPSFLGFPVAGYAGGFSVTGGLAGATRVGEWSVGLAGSVRVNSEFTPYADSAGPIVYKPGVEARLRGGADRLVGSSRLSLGLTYSTFGDDQVGLSGGAGRGQYRPGTRWLAEAGLIAPVGRGTLNLTAWNYHRAAGDTTGASAGNRENLVGGDMTLSLPLSPGLALEPVVAGRVSKPQAGSGKMIGLGTGLRARLANTVTLTPLARYDTGTLSDGSGVNSNLHGWYASALLRIAF